MGRGRGHGERLHMATEKALAGGSILVAVAALRFLYKINLRRDWDLELEVAAPRKPKKLPVVLSQDEVARFLSAVDNLKHRVILTVCYASGLRISEAVRLKSSSIDSQRMVIRVEQGKWRKDPSVIRSPKLPDM